MVEEENNNKKKIVMPSWFASAVLFVTVIILILILYLQFVRYSLVLKSLELGDTGSTALLLTPEISTGITQILRI